VPFERRAGPTTNIPRNIKENGSKNMSLNCNFEASTAVFTKVHEICATTRRAEELLNRSK
jgi:hypothetical protein